MYIPRGVMMGTKERGRVGKGLNGCYTASQLFHTFICRVVICVIETSDPACERVMRAYEHFGR